MCKHILCLPLWFARTSESVSSGVFFCYLNTGGRALTLTHIIFLFVVSVDVIDKGVGLMFKHNHISHSLKGVIRSMLSVSI